jgi:hypothetical protein
MTFEVTHVYDEKEQSLLDFIKLLFSTFNIKC